MARVVLVSLAAMQILLLLCLTNGIALAQPAAPECPQAASRAPTFHLPADRLRDYLQKRLERDIREFDGDRFSNKVAFTLLTAVTLLAGFGSALLIALDLGKSERMVWKGPPSGRPAFIRSRDGAFRSSRLSVSIAGGGSGGSTAASSAGVFQPPRVEDHNHAGRAGFPPGRSRG